jgi:hypothetical protein
MTSSESQSSNPPPSVGSLSPAQISHGKCGLRLKECEKNRVKGPHQGGQQQTKETKEAVQTYWWAPTFFLLLMEAAKKVHWVSLTKIV